MSYVPNRQILLVLESASNAANSFLTTFLVLVIASQSTFALFTLLGTSIRATRITYQFLIINQFNILKIRSDLSYRKVLFRFFIYSFVIMLSFNLLQFGVLSFLKTDAKTYIFLLLNMEVVSIFIRAHILKRMKYVLLLTFSLIKMILSVSLIYLFVDQKSTVGQVYLLIFVSQIVASVPMLATMKISICPITLIQVKKEFWSTGRFQLPTGIFSWTKSSFPYFIINFTLGDEKLVIFRTIQLLFAPAALIFSIFESYIPQILAATKNIDEGIKLLFKQLKQALYYVPIIILSYIIILYFLKSAIVFEQLELINLEMIILYGAFVLVMPFNAIVQIGLRFIDKAPLIFQISFIDVFIMPMCVYILCISVGILGVIGYLFLSLSILCTCYFLILRRFTK